MCKDLTYMVDYALHAEVTSSIYTTYYTRHLRLSDFLVYSLYKHSNSITFYLTRFFRVALMQAFLREGSMKLSKAGVALTINFILQMSISGSDYFLSSSPFARMFAEQYKMLPLLHKCSCLLVNEPERFNVVKVAN